MGAGELWSACLGDKMTRRMLRILLPDLLWNQELYIVRSRG
jgi:hypothetical protein